MTDSSRAAELLLRPTPSLIAEEDSAYTLQDDEKVLVAVFWSFLANAAETGVFDVEYVHAGLPAAVLRLAGKYPTFFRTDGTGHIAAALVSAGDTNFVCGQSCLPSAATLLAAAKEAGGAIKAIKGLSALTKTFDAGKLVLANGKVLTEMLKAVWASDSTSVLQSLNSVTGAILGVASVVGTGLGVASVGAIYAVLNLTVTIGEVIAAADACVNHQTQNCCGAHGACNTPPPSKCAVGVPMSLAVATPTGTCNDGVCVYGVTTVACPSGERCKATSPGTGSCSPCFSVCGSACVDTAAARLDLTATWIVTPAPAPDSCWWSGTRTFQISGANVDPAVIGMGVTAYTSFGSLSPATYAWSTAALQTNCPPDGALQATRTETIAAPAVRLDVDCTQQVATLDIPLVVSATNHFADHSEGPFVYNETVHVVVQTTPSPSGISIAGSTDLGAAYGYSDVVLTINGTLSAIP